MSRLSIVLAAQPNLDFAPGSNRGSISIEPKVVEFGSLDAAVEVFMVFCRDNDLGAANLGGDAGLVRNYGAPLCRIALCGTLWAVDPTGKETGKKFEPPTLGSVARGIRQAAGWSRARFAAAVNLSLPMLTAFEAGKNRLTVEQRQRILRHPARRACTSWRWRPASSPRHCRDLGTRVALATLTAR